VHAEYQHREVRTQRAQLLDQLQSALAGQGNVEQDHIPRLFPDAFEDFLAGRGFAEHDLIRFVG